MDSPDRQTDRRALAAYTLPMVAFLAGLAIVSGLKKIGGAFWLDAPEYWVYPLQTLVCAALLWWFRAEYELRRITRVIFTVCVGIAAVVIWISPQAVFGFPPRTDGFNPDIFRSQPALYWFTLVMRFVRLAIVVPFVEEIFWRGFLLRYFINERFRVVPIGAFSWFSFGAVTIGFMLVHAMPDWPAAAITGALYNFVAYRTKSLSSCILVHVITNLLLGFWIMATGQWGFW